MPSIVNGLFSARSGIASHGVAIAVVGDNISNASTLGFKAARADFEDLVAGGQASGRITGAGSQVSAINPVFSQGTLEFTSRALDLAIDGNGFFVVADGANRFYTRAGNFKVDSGGNIISQDGNQVLGFPAGGTGALETLNVNTISQSSVNTNDASIAGNLDAGATGTVANTAAIPTVPLANSGSADITTDYTDLNNAAQFSTVVPVFDSLGAKHSVSFFFYKDSDTPNTWYANGYVDTGDVNPAIDAGYPRLINATPLTLSFDSAGQLTTATPSITAQIPWANGSSATTNVTFDFGEFTQYSAASNVLSITQDGQGVGTVTSLSIGQDGTIAALLDNGQSANIGQLGMVNFANPEGLSRVGNNLLQQSIDSGEPVVGRPQSGTFGAIQSGSVELSTVDIASEFVKLITLQRGFQANSRIITTINQLLSDIIQLA